MLIKCNECGYEFSDIAEKCPKCGMPNYELISKTMQIEAEEKQRQQIYQDRVNRYNNWLLYSDFQKEKNDEICIYIYLVFIGNGIWIFC